MLWCKRVINKAVSCLRGWKALTRQEDDASGYTHKNKTRGSRSIIPNALDVMYREHHIMVFRTAYRITGNVANAEDVLQTVFLRMARK